MNVSEVFRFSYQSLVTNKLRASLTVLGMAIGTASIILVVTISLTGRDYILRQIEGVGSNFIYLYYEVAGTVSDPRTLSGYLTQGDLRAIQELPQVAYATGVVTSHDQLTIDARTRDVSVIGVTSGYFMVRNLRILSGRYFDDLDERSSARVCVITEALARKLLGSLDVRGKTLRFFQVRFEVIGVFREGVETYGQSEVATYSALVPLGVLQRFNGSDKLDMIYASARSGELVPSATQAIRQVLEVRHRQSSAYRVENLAEILKAAGRISNALSAVLFLLGAISLVISGVGIMNIMLVTVTERTREIGLKMATGARRREILQQFLVESLLLATCGGLLGVALGLVAPLLAKHLSGFEVPVSGASILVALLLSLVVGVTSGLIPANRAAKLSPTEALRYE